MFSFVKIQPKQKLQHKETSSFYWRLGCNFPGLLFVPACLKQFAGIRINIYLQKNKCRWWGKTLKSLSMYCLNYFLHRSWTLFRIRVAYLKKISLNYALETDISTNPRVCDNLMLWSRDTRFCGLDSPNLVAVTIRHRGGNMSEGISLGWCHPVQAVYTAHRSLIYIWPHTHTHTHTQTDNVGVQILSECMQIYTM